MVDIIWKNMYDITKCNVGNAWKVWDHKTHDPGSVTAGVKGLHVYVLETGEIMAVVSNP